MDIKETGHITFKGDAIFPHSQKKNSRTRKIHNFFKFTQNFLLKTAASDYLFFESLMAISFFFLNKMWLQPEEIKKNHRRCLSFIIAKGHNTY